MGVASKAQIDGREQIQPLLLSSLVPFKDHPSGCICDLTGTEYKICAKYTAMCYYV